MKKLKRFLLPFLISLILASQAGCSQQEQEKETTAIIEKDEADVHSSIEAAVKNESTRPQSDTLATIYYVDVAQADCSVVVSGNSVVVIDTGDVGTKNNVVSYLKGLGITKIDYLVLTHPHADHIGGAPEVINAFEIENILMPEITTTSKIFERTLDAIADNGYSITIPNRGDMYRIDNGDITILSDQTISWGDDLNSYSLVLNIRINSVNFLFTGDAEQAVEEDVVKSGLIGEVSVYQVGHHGSYTATSEVLLSTIKPKDAIISCGKDNSYGHPHDVTVDRLDKHNVNCYRTDISGTIVVKTDGINYTISAEPMPKGEVDLEEVSNNDKSDSTDISSEYILNTSSKKIHIPTCQHVEKMSEKNKQEYTGDYRDLLDQGYTTCGTCM